MKRIASILLLTVFLISHLMPFLTVVSQRGIAFFEEKFQNADDKENSAEELLLVLNQRLYSSLEQKESKGCTACCCGAACPGGDRCLCLGKTKTEQNTIPLNPLVGGVVLKKQGCFPPLGNDTFDLILPQFSKTILISEIVLNNNLFPVNEFNPGNKIYTNPDFRPESPPPEQQSFQL